MEGTTKGVGIMVVLIAGEGATNGISPYGTSDDWRSWCFRLL